MRKPVKRVMAINVTLGAAIGNTNIQNFSVDKDCNEIIAVIPDSSLNFLFKISEAKTNTPWFEESKSNLSTNNPRIDLGYKFEDKNMVLTCINQTAVAMTARVLILVG